MKTILSIILASLVCLSVVVCWSLKSESLFYKSKGDGSTTSKGILHNYFENMSYEWWHKAVVHSLKDLSPREDSMYREVKYIVIYNEVPMPKPTPERDRSNDYNFGSPPDPIFGKPYNMGDPIFGGPYNSFWGY